MAKKQNTKLSLKKISKIINAIGIVIGAFTLICFIEAIVFRLTLENKEVSKIFFLIGFISVIIFLLYVIIVSMLFYIRIFRNVLDVSSQNLDKLKKLDSNLTKFSLTGIAEINDMNTDLEDISKVYNHTIVTTSNFDYSKLNIEHVDNQPQVIVYDSLVENIQSLLSTSATFRNAFIELEFNVEKVTEEQEKFIIKSILDFYNDSTILVAPNFRKKRIVIYHPNIDSISKMKEQVALLIKKCVVYEHIGKDETLVCPTASIVMYPYSAIDDIFSDLRYARRKNQSINTYLPKRMIRGDNKFFSNSMSLSNVSKILESIPDFTEINDDEELKEKFEYYLRKEAVFYNFDFAGIVSYDDFLSVYKPYVHFNESDNEKDIFTDNSIFDEKIVMSLAKIIDRDGSYFFSKRENANEAICTYLDILNISSGLFFITKYKGKIIAITYFLNRDSDLNIDSYLRESLVVFARIISDSIKAIKIKQKALDFEEDNQTLLKISNMKIYTIKKDNYKLLSISDSLKDIYTRPIVGQTCYEYLYNKTSPCENCPLRSGSKMESEICGEKHLSSLILDNNKYSSCQMLLTPESKNYFATNRFNSDFLINSYYSLIYRMNNIFSGHTKGYIILIKINNHTDIIDKYGDESYLRYVRDFLKAVCKYDNGIANTYLYRNNIFAIVANECGQVDVIEKCEKIYDLSRVNYLDKSLTDNLFSLSFITFRYPMNFASSYDLIKEIELFLKNDIAKVKDGYIYFAENDYTRSANNTEFMLQLLDEATSTRDLKVQLLPFVRNKKLTGAELLLRLRDDSKNALINTYDLIKVAIKNNRIGIITNILIDNIGEYYKNYGFSLFRITGFKRLTINTDSSYFDDSTFMDSLEHLVQEHHFQKNFLGLEITEKELSEHFDKMKDASKKLYKVDIDLICDAYTGEYISLEKIKALGINMIKISRQIVSNIDKDEAIYNELLSLINSAYERDIKVCLVGVENEHQYRLITEKYPDIPMQGYYLYQPMDSQDLFGMLRKTNID